MDFDRSKVAKMLHMNRNIATMPTTMYIPCLHMSVYTEMEEVYV